MRDFENFFQSRSFRRFFCGHDLIDLGYFLQLRDPFECAWVCLTMEIKTCCLELITSESLPFRSEVEHFFQIGDNTIQRFLRSVRVLQYVPLAQFLKKKIVFFQSAQYFVQYGTVIL